MNFKTQCNYSFVSLTLYLINNIKMSKLQISRLTKKNLYKIECYLCIFRIHQVTNMIQLLIHKIYLSMKSQKKITIREETKKMLMHGVYKQMKQTEHF